MFICIYKHESVHGTGETLKAAYDELGDPDFAIEDCDFYVLGEKVEVEVKIVRKETIVAKGKGK
jgi:hypothetical protein